MLMAAMTDRMPLLRIRDAAKRLNVTPLSVYRWVNAGQLRAYRLGGEHGPLRIDPRELERWLAQRSSQGRPPPTPPGQGATSTGRKSVGTSARRQNQGGDTHA